jgi:hypothetical protein
MSDSTRALRAPHGGREEPVTAVPEFIVNVLATPVGTVDVMTLVSSQGLRPAKSNENVVKRSATESNFQE